MPLRPGVSAELLEEDAPELHRRAEHELLARELVRARLELLDAVGEARGDLAHAVRVDPDARVLHRGEHRGQRKLDLVVEPLHPALADALAEERSEPAGGLGVTDERGRLLLRGRVGLELEAVFRGEVVEGVLGPAGIDQVRGEQRVVGGLDAKRLGVVNGEIAGLATACDSGPARRRPRRSVAIATRPPSAAYPTRPRSFGSSPSRQETDCDSAFGSSAAGSASSSVSMRPRSARNS